MTVLALSALAPGAMASTVIENHPGQFSQLGWDWNPWILSSLTIALLAYMRGLQRMNRAARARVVSMARRAAFGAGIGALFAVLISPLDALDDQLFTAHMLQHLVLMMIAPPLLILGRPAMVFLWTFPLPARRAIGRVWAGSGMRHLMQRVMSPSVVWVLCSAALWFWHLPGPYGWALASEWVHAIEHICFFATSLMFWSLVLEPIGQRRLAYGSTMLFVATFGVQNGFLGAILTFSGRPLYAGYLPTTAAWGLTPLEDQQLAGLLMWIPASLIHLSTLAALFVAWMRAAERRELSMAAPTMSTTSRNAALRCAGIVSIAAIGLSGCSHSSPASQWTIAGADRSRAPALIQSYGCGSCHSIPGIPKATGEVGPPLAEFGRRAYVAGVLTNTPENLMLWLRNPQSIVPGNAMLNLGVTEQDARDIAAYLYALPIRNRAD